MLLTEISLFILLYKMFVVMLLKLLKIGNRHFREIISTLGCRSHFIAACSLNTITSFVFFCYFVILCKVLLLNNCHFMVSPLV